MSTKIDIMPSPASSPTDTPTYAVADWKPLMPSPDTQHSGWPSEPPPAYTPVAQPISPTYCQIPNENCLVPQNVPIALQERSDVTVEEEGVNEVVGCDKRLNESAEEIMKFFLSHLEPPRMTVRIKGHHTEVRHHTTHVNGHAQHHTDHHEVTDFEFNVDLSGYIRPQWNFITSHPQPLAQTIQQYINSKSSIKEIQLKKDLVWDYDMLKVAITNLIRSTGYPAKIDITFPKQKDQVIVRYDNFWTRMANNTCVKVLCCITCLCLIAYPVKKCIDYEDNTSLTANYNMNISGQDFYYKNANLISNMVIGRVKGQTVNAQ